MEANMSVKVPSRRAPAMERIEEWVDRMGGDQEVFGAMFLDALAEAYAEAIEKAQGAGGDITRVPWLERAIREKGWVNG
jgi:hypothetical protein